MARLRLRYVQAFVDKKTGIAFHYFRRPGFPRIRLPGLPGSAEFMGAYQAALAQDRSPIGQRRVTPGSVSATVAAYLDSALHFGSSAAGTQTQRRTILERFREQYGDLPIAQMHSKFIRVALEKKKPHAARNWLKTIRSLCQFAVEREWIASDPTQGIKLKKLTHSELKGHHTWTEDEIALFEAKHPIGSKARLALALLLYTVQRRGDVIRMGPQHVRNGMLHIPGQQKTDAELTIPVQPELQAALDATPSGHLTFLVTRSGRPYAGNDFTEQFRAWCDEAGLPKRCVPHGLRKAGCTRLADAGCSASEIMAWSGHKTLAEVSRYTKAADQKRLAVQALARVNAVATPTVKENRG